MKTKTCIVTGAGRGIGAATAPAFAREGATVVVTDKNEGSAADVARETGGHHMRLDVASEGDWAALAEAWPACDVLLNNAGITGFEEAVIPHEVRCWFLDLQPYCPDLNPTEIAFSKLKAHPSSNAARTFDQIFDALAESCNLLTSDEYWNIF